MNVEPRLWKKGMRARLAEERSALLVSMLGLSSHTLETTVVTDGLTTTQVLILIAHEDRVRAKAIEDILVGRAQAERDVFPTGLTAPFAAALAAALDWRSRLLSALARVPEDELFRPRADGMNVAGWIEECLERDGVWTDCISEWRAPRKQDPGAFPRDLLLAGIRAARKEMLTCIALVSEEARPGWRLGAGSLQRALEEIVQRERDVLGVLSNSATDWPRTSLDSWHATWTALHYGHHALLRRVESMSEDDLVQTPTMPLSLTGTLYHALRQGISMDRHVAAAVRGSLDVMPPASRVAP